MSIAKKMAHKTKSINLEIPSNNKYCLFYERLKLLNVHCILKLFLLSKESNYVGKGRNNLKHAIF